VLTTLLLADATCFASHPMGWFDGYQAFGGGTGVGRFQMSMRFIDAPFHWGCTK
jgi:hypothetical protein